MSTKPEITFDLADVNISDILDQIHANMKARGYDIEELKRLGKGIEIKSPLSVAPGGNEFLNNACASVSASCNVEYWWLIPPQGGLKGKLRVFMNKVMRKLTFFYMKHVIDQQNIFNLNTASAVNQLTGTCNHLMHENNDLLMRVTALTNENAALSSSVQKMGATIDATMEKYVEQISAIEEMYASRQNRLDSVNTAMASRLRRLENQLSEMEAPAKTDTPSPYTAGAASFDYFLFESKFRGSSEEIKKRQERYLPYFSGQQNILDIGCGRGEFLALLNENGIQATGIDLSEENVHCCTKAGLNAVLGNALDYLAEVPNESLGGIFCAQVIEHLSTEQLITLIRLAGRKLLPGATLVMETLNPQCLMIYAESMYLDPSHTKPVHPYTVKFIAECEGFAENELLYLSPSPEYKLPMLESHPEADETLRTVNNLLFGCREYALVAKKTKAVEA